MKANYQVRVSWTALGLFILPLIGVGVFVAVSSLAQSAVDGSWAPNSGGSWGTRGSWAFSDSSRPAVATTALNPRATGSAVRVGDKITEVNILPGNGGSGYTTPPTVIISDPGANGKPARGVALLGTGASAGTVTGVDIIDPGSGYTGTPAVTVTFSGELDGISMTETGSGYPSAPSIAFTAGGGFTSAPTVTFRGGIGAGAVATAVIGSGGTAGRVVSITVNNGGSGYSTTTLPTIQIITTSGGSGAAATAIVDGSGVITGFNVTNQGSGYSAAVPPSVNIVSPTPTSPGGGTNTFLATGTAVVSDGQVVDVEVTFPGVGYTAPPQVIFSGGGAVGNGNVIATAEVDAGGVSGVIINNPGGALNATGTATLGAGGGVSSIAVTSRGVGYTSAPTVVIGAPLIRQALVSSSRSGNSVSAITVTNPGSGYLVNPAVTFSNVGWRGYTAAPRVKFTKSGITGALATATRNGTTGGITAVAVQDGGNGYTVAPTVVFVGGNGTGATATASVSGGLVTALNVTAGGTGYGGVPTVTLSGGGGSGATATAILTGSTVTGLTLTNPGSGYTSAPTVAFTSIPVTNPATATAIISAAGKVTGVTVDTPGSYTSAPIVAFSTGGVTHAVATATVPNGELATLTLIYGGSGYAAVAPTISFEGSISNGGSHATATASLTGGVVTGLNITTPGGALRAAATSTRAPDGTIASVTVTTAGTGYISDPIVTLAAPTGVSTAVHPMPGGVGAFLHFNRDITGNFGITLEAARTVGSLTIGDTGGEDYTLSAGTGGVNSSLTFDMGLLGAGMSYLNKTQGDQDVISARVVLNDELHARVNAGRVTLSGGIAGTGTLVSSGNGILTVRGESTGSNNDLWLWHRGAGNAGAQVELGASGGPAFGNIRLGNGSYGTAGFAVLQLLENRVLSLADPALYQGDQISDNATVVVDAATNRWGYFKLMGGSETIGNIIDSGSALVLENMEGETINTNAVLTLGGNNLDSFVGGFIRNRSGGSGTGTLGLTKNGTGTLTLQGGNITYTGSTLLNGGTLNLVNATGFASAITAAAGTRINVDTLTGTTNFDEAVLGDSVLWKLGTGVLNFNSGQTKLDDVFHTGGTLTVRAGAATLRGGKNEISGSLTVQGDSSLNKSMAISAGLSVGGINANGRFGQTGSVISVIGQQFNADSVGNAVEGVLESSGPINITNTAFLLGSSLLATDRIVQNTATSTTTLTLTDVSNLVIGSVLTLKLSEPTAGVSIQPNTRLLAVNQNNRTVILDKTASIPSGRGITFTYTSVTDGAVRGESLNFTDVVHDGKKFIAITEKGTIHTSLNGTVWDLRYTDPAGIPFNSLTWTGERAVIVGSQGRVLTSTDGRTWAVQDVGSATDLRGVTSTNVAFTGDLVAGSTTVSNVTGAATFLPGTPVFGFATAPDARVATANAAGNSLTVDSPALDTATNVDFGYFRGNTTAGNSTVSAVHTAQNLQAGTAISGSGITAGTTIGTVDGPNNSITLSLNASTGGTVPLFTLTGDLSLNSSTITNLSNTQGLAVGMVLTGRGIPAGTRITAINVGASTLTLSDTVTTTTSAVPMSIYTGTLAATSNQVTNVTSLGAFTADMAARGVLVPVGTFVVSSTANTLTLSQSATAAATSGDLKASKTSRISTGTFANGNTVVTNVSNLTGLAVGMQVALPGVIPPGTVINAISAPNVTLSNPALTGPITLAFSAGFDLVAVGESGFVSTSAGGGTGTWLTRNSTTTRDLNAIGWSESLLVAVGARGRVISSPDGVTWSRQSPPLTDPTGDTPNVILDVNTASKTVTMNNNALVTSTQASFGAFKGNTTVGSAVITNVTGMPSLRPGLPLTSTLGIAAGATIRSVNEAGFSFVMSTPATGTATATPIRTFTGLAVNGQTRITDVTDFKGLVVGMSLHGSAITGTAVIISLDPENRELFLSTPATASGRGSFGVFYGNITIGSATVSNVTNMTSLRNLQGTAHLTAGRVVAAVPGLLGAGLTVSSYSQTANSVTLSGGAALASASGVPLLTLTGRVTDGSNVITNVSNFTGISVNMNLFVTGTTLGPEFPSSFNIDSFDSTAQTITLSGVPNVNDETTAVTVGLGLFLGTTTVSSNLVTALTNYSGRAAPSIMLPDLQDIAWTGTQFVAVGEYGAVFTSPTGVTWTPRDSTTGRDFQAVALSGAQILAAGQDGIILKSANGIAWTSARPPDSPALNDIRHIDQIQAVITSSGKTLALGNGGLATADANTWSSSVNDTFSGTQTTLAIGGNRTTVGSLQIDNIVTTSPTTSPINGTLANRNNPNRIDDATTLMSRGGIFWFLNNGANATFSENIGKLLLSQGELKIFAARAGTAGTSTLTFDSLQQMPGATLDFTGIDYSLGSTATVADSLGVNTRNRIFFTQAPVLDNGIIGGWATIDGEWATYGADGVLKLDTYDTGDQTGWISTDNVKMQAARTLNARRAVNSLNLLGQTLTMNGLQLSIESGGLLATSGTINSAGAALVVGTPINQPKNLNVINSSTLTLNTEIEDFQSDLAVNATSAGSTVVSMTAANIVGLMAGMEVSNSPLGTSIAIPAGTRIESVDVANSRITLTAATTAAIAANTLVRFTGGSVGLTKSGAGLLALTRTNNYSGKTYINLGTVQISATSALGAAPTSFVQDQIQINGGALQIGHIAPAPGTPTPLDDFNIAFNDNLRGITIGLAGGRIEVGRLNPDNNNATLANAVPIVNLAITNPINALGVLELAVRSSTTTLQRNTLTLGTAASTNNYASGIKTEALFDGLITILGNNTIGGIIQEGGTFIITGNNNFTAPIRSLLGNITITGTNTWFGGTEFERPIEMQAGTLKLTTPNALGSGGLDLVLGGAGKLTLAGLPLSIRQISSASLSVIDNNDAPESLTTSTELTFNLNTNQTYIGTIKDGVTLGNNPHVAPIKLIKTGPGMLTLSNAGSSYTGGIEIREGALNVTNIDTVSDNSALGKVESYDPALLVIDKAVLSFTPTDFQTMDRSFTMGSGPNGATLVANGVTQIDRVTIGKEFRDAFGGNPDISNPIAFKDSGPRFLTLSGSGRGDNTLLLELRDKSISEISGLMKAGQGYWVLDKAAPYSGYTTINDGTLVVTKNDALGTVGVGTVVDASNDTLTGNLPNGTPLTFPLFYDTTLPGGVLADTAYYVIGSNGSTFQIAATPGGAALPITTNGLNVKLVPKIDSFRSTVFNETNETFTGSLPIGAQVSFNTQLVPGVATPLPPGGLLLNTVYYVVDSTGSTFKISETPGGPVFDFSTGTPGSLYYSTPNSGNPSGGVNLTAGTLELRSVNYLTPEALMFEGGALLVPADTQSIWSGDLHVNANATIRVGQGGQLILNGNFLGTSFMTQEGEGDVIMRGEMLTATTNLLNATREYAVRAGSLILDYSLNNGSKLSNTANLRLGGSRRGGTIVLSGGSHEEIVGQGVLEAGASKIFRDGGTSTISLNNISRSTGSSLYVDLARIAKTDVLNNNGILGSWAIIRDAVTNAFYVIPGTNSATIPVTADASTDRVSATGLVFGTLVRLTTTGTMPGGLSENTNYFVINVSPLGVTLAQTPSVLAQIVDITSVGTGTLTLTTQTPFTANAGSDTFATLGDHRLANGSIVRVSSYGTLPSGLNAGTDYYVIDRADRNFRLSTVINGPAVNIISVGTGVHVVTTQGAEKRVGSAALTFSVNPAAFPGSDGNDRIKVAIRPQAFAGPITDEITGLGTVGDPYIYTIKTTTDNNSNTAVIAFVLSDNSSNPAVGSSKLIDVKSSGGSTDADSVADTGTYGAPTFLAHGSNDNGGIELDWARNEGTADGYIMPNASYASGWSALNHTAVTTSFSAGSTDTYSLRFASQNASTVTLGGSTTRGIRSGGILISPTVGANDSSILGTGSLTMGGQGNLQNFLIHQYNELGSLVIGTRITNRAVITRTGRLSSAANNVVAGLSSTSDLTVGMLVTGAGINAGTTIASIDPDGHTIFLSQGHSVNATRPTLSFSSGGPAISRAGTLVSGDRRRIFGITVPGVGVNPSTVSTTDLYIGMPIAGPGIPVGSTITFIFDDNDIQVSTNHFFTGESSVMTLTPTTGIEKLGPGMLVLSGENDYSGSTFIGNGVLRAQSLTDGGVPGSLGASNAASANLFFNGGELQYVGENSRTNRGFQLSEFASINIGHERTSSVFTGAVVGTDRLEKDGPGTLIFNGNVGLEAIRVEQGRLLLQSVDTNFTPAGFAGTNFATTNLTSLRVAGGTLELRGTPEGNVNQIFGSQFVIEEGGSEVKVTSVAATDPNNLVGVPPFRTTSLSLMGQEEQTDVLRMAGGTVRFVENPEVNGGAANIFLFQPLNSRQKILPWATYRNLGDPTQGGVNDFAMVSSTSGAVISANLYYDSESLADWASTRQAGTTVNASEGGFDPQGNIRTFNGTVSSRKYVNLMRYESDLNSVVTIEAGQTLELVSGAILSAFNVRTGNKQILGPGNITGGSANTENADFMMHNYNSAAAFTLGANVVNRTVQTTNSAGTLGKGTLKVDEAEMKIETGADTNFFRSARAGMQISGPGLPPGTIVLEVDGDNRRLLLSQAATSNQNSQIYTLTEILNFVQTGVGTTILSGDNTYTGNTYVHGGVLRLDSANAVPGGIGSSGGTSALIVEGGVIGLGLGDFARSLGSGVDQVQFKGNGGFAAYGADRLVNFGGGSVPELLRFGNNGFVPDGSSLVFGSHDATHKIVFQHPIDLSAFSQAVRVENGPAVVEAELAGGLSGLGRMIKFGLGTLRLNATSTNTGGIELAEGRLIAANVPNVFGSTAGTAGPLRLGTSYTNTDTRSALELEIEGGTVGKKLEVGVVNATSSPWTVGGQVDSSQASADVGQHVSMQVVEGFPAMAYYDVTNQDLKYVRALDDRGIRWGIPVTVASRGNVGKYPSLSQINGFPAISYYDETTGSLMYVRATDAPGAFWGTPIPVVAQAETVLTVAVQTDGKVLVGGAFTQIDGVSKNRLIRLNTDGSMDADFNAFIMNGEVRDILIQADGKIIIGGTFTAVRQDDSATNNLTRNRIARLNLNGSLDVGFDPNLNGDVRVLMAQGDGRFLVGGAFTAVGGAGRTRMARLNANGTLDATFVSPDIRNGEVRDMVLEPAGTYVISGTFTSVRGDGNRNRLARITSNGGAIDAFNPDANGDVNSVVLLPDAKLLVGGSFGAFAGGVISRTRLARLNPNGAVDLTFAQEVNGTVNRLELESTGDVLVAGLFTQLGDFARNSLGRVKADGTVLVRDIVAGTSSSGPADLSALGSTVFFAANDAVKGSELWKSDGTVGGTVLVKDLVAGAASSSPASLTTMGGTLFFTATDAANGRELWKSDGTDAGTVLLKDIVAGTTGSAPANLTVVGSTLFFTATGAANGTELWKSDGTADGTVLVKDIVVGATGSSPTSLTAVGSTLFFAATDATNGTELWKSDGTALGTELVADIVVGATGSSPTSLTAVGSTLFFAATDATNGTELWKSDGTALGTELVADIVGGAVGSSPASLTAVGSSLFFAATDPAAGSELWKSDGTAIGTILVKDILAGTGGSAPTNLSAVGSTLYFSAADAANGRELWKSDGTAGGTALLRDLSVGTADSSPTKVVAAGSTLYFTANDGINGRELWKSDGTAFGTIDATFNPNPDQEVRSISLMTDGNIILGGLFSRLNGLTQQVVARVSAAGVPDVGFNRRIIDVGQYTSLLFVNGVPAIAFRDVVNGELEYVRANDSNGAGWGTAQVLDDTADNVGVGISMIIANIGGDLLTKDDRGTISETDDEVTISATPANIGTPVIAYGDATNSRIKYVVAINVNGTGLAEPLTNWSDPVVLPNTGNVGAEFSLSLVDGFPAIAYQTSDTKDLKFMRATNAAGLTNNLRDPTTLEILRKFVSELAFSSTTSWDSPITLDSAGDVGQSPSLALVNTQPTTVKDRPAVSYYDATNGDLKYVVAPNSTGAPINSATPNVDPWGVPTVLASQNDVGRFTSLAMVNGRPGVGYYNVTSGDLAFLLLNDASGYSRISFDGDSTWSGAVTLNGSLMIAPASGQTTTLSGALTGAAGFKLVSDGILNLTNAANNFGTSLALPGVTTGPGAAVNGAAIIRTGSLHVSSSTALGEATVELGDALPQVISVDRASSFGTVLANGGTFNALHDGRNQNVNGPGAFVKVGATVDGHYYGLVATIVDPAIDRLSGNLSAGTEIQLIGEQLSSGTAADTPYYVINPNGTNFEISLTPGGARVSITTAGSKVFYIETAKLNAKILIKDEGQNPERNGIYQFMIDPDNTSLAEGVMNLARVAAFDSPSEMLYGVRVSVQNGTSAGKAYFLAGNVIDLNYSAVHWVEDRLNSSVALLATVAGLTISNPVDVNAVGGTGSSVLGAVSSVTTGGVNFTGAVTLQNQMTATQELETLNLTSSTSTGFGLVLGGVISEADGGIGATKDRLTLIKTGSGTATLTANNTFSGGITINQGTLLVMNTPSVLTDSATGSGPVTVSAGAVLGGSGHLNSPVTLAGAPGNSAVLRPGDPTTSSSPVETLTINQPLTVSADSVVEFTIGATNFTKLAGTSIFLTTSSSRLLVQLESGYTPAIGAEFDLLDFTSLTIHGGAANLLNLLLLPVTTVWDTSTFMSTGKIIAQGDAEPTAITADPASQTIQQGGSHTFTIVGGYTGTAPVSFQWTKDGQDILGATNETLVISGATQASEGDYRVRVFNPANAAGALSGPATLTVDWPLSFAVDLPLTRQGSAGEPITFQVVMNGEGTLVTPITYQWQKVVSNVVSDIIGQTSSSFTIASVTTTDAASYQVLVKGPFNLAGILSKRCVLSVSSGPAVVLDPLPISQTLLIGSTLALAATPGGDNNLRIMQWRRNGTAIAGANSPTLTIPNITLAMAGDYTFKLDNKVTTPGPDLGKAKTATSPSARITVVDNPFSIVPGQIGKQVVLTINVAGPTATTPSKFPTFVWRKNGGDLPSDGRFTGGTTKSLTIKNLVHTDTDTYTCIVTGAPNSVPLSVIGGTQFLRVYDAAPQLVETTTPPAGIVGGAYSWKIPVISDVADTDIDHVAKWKTTPSAYAVTGLPAGLKFDPKSGVISGRPTTKTDTVKYPNGNPVTITVTNAVNKDTWSTFILIMPLPSGIAGTYAGPIARDPVLNGNLGGRFDMTVTTAGVASGKVTLGSMVSRPFTATNGSLEIDINNLNHQATFFLPATTTLPSLTISFKLDITPGTVPATLLADTTIIAGSSSPVTFEGWRNNWAATAVAGVSAKADTFAGDYTFGIMLPDGSPLIADPQVPQGAGYGIFKVASAGTFTLAGRTPDGETLTGGYWLGPNGQFFIYQTLYTTTTKGSILGKLQIETNTPSTDNDLFGDLTHVRPPNNGSVTTARTYRSGFGTTQTAAGVTPTTVTTPVSLIAVGGRYIAPLATGPVFMGLAPLSDPNRNAELIFSEDGVLPARTTVFPAAYDKDIAAAFNPNIPVTLDVRSAVKTPLAKSADNPASTTFAPVVATGAFSGKFTLSDSIPRLPQAPLVIARSVSYYGVAIRERTSATGQPRVVESYGVGHFIIDQLPPIATTPANSTPRLSGMASFQAP